MVFYSAPLACTRQNGGTLSQPLALTLSGLPALEVRRKGELCAHVSHRGAGAWMGVKQAEMRQALCPPSPPRPRPPSPAGISLVFPIRVMWVMKNNILISAQRRERGKSARGKGGDSEEIDFFLASSDGCARVSCVPAPRCKLNISDKYYSDQKL